METKNKQRQISYILICDKTGFQSYVVRRHKEGHYILVKESNQQEAVTAIIMYICTLHQTTRIYTPNTVRRKGAGRLEYSKSERLPHATVISGQSFQTKINANALELDQTGK